MADRNELNRDHAGVATGSQRVQTYRASQYHIGTSQGSMAGPDTGGFDPANGAKPLRPQTLSGEAWSVRQKRPVVRDFDRRAIADDRPHP